MERFWNKVSKTDSCWEWTAAKINTGYGVIYYKGRARLAHRVAWELTGQPEIPEGMVLDHLCKNRACVNPSHIRICTFQQNSARGLETANGRKTQCKQGHPFNKENTGHFGGRRYCKTCRRAWRAKYRAQPPPTPKRAS